MHAVTTGAVGDGLIAGFGRESVETLVEADQAVFRHFHLPGELDIAVAAAAGIADMRAEYG